MTPRGFNRPTIVIFMYSTCGPELKLAYIFARVGANEREMGSHSNGVLVACNHLMAILPYQPFYSVTEPC